MQRKRATAKVQKRPGHNRQRLAVAILLLAAVAGTAYVLIRNQGYELPAGWPATTFEPVTAAEMSAYLEVLPRVVSALRAADFRPVQTEPTDLILDMGGTIEGMKSVPGVLDSLAAAGMSWESFRTTTYKVLAVNYQMALGIGEGLAQGMQGQQGKEFRQRIARMKRVFDQVPPENKEAFFANIGRLQGLLDLGQPTATE